jgi:hypothetical protein
MTGCGRGLRHLLQAVVDAVHGEGQPVGRDGRPRDGNGLPGPAPQGHLRPVGLPLLAS